MKNNKNKLTFSQRALAIEKKYPRASFDSIEKRDLEAEMERLIDEQEAYKEANGLNEQEELQFADGGVLDYLTKIEPDYLLNTPNTLDTSLETNKLSNKILSNDLSNITDSTSNSDTPWASIISAGANIGGNLLSAALNKKQPTINNVAYTPEKLNLYSSKEEARREADVAKNTLLRNLRVAGTPGQYLSNVGAGVADTQRALGKTLTDIGTKEQTYNAGVTNQARQFNAANQFKANLINAAAQKQFGDEQLGFYQGAINTIPQYIKDVNMQKADQANVDVYQKLLDYLGRNYKLNADLYGNTPFSLNVRQ